MQLMVIVYPRPDGWLHAIAEAGERWGGSDNRRDDCLISTGCSPVFDLAGESRLEKSYFSRAEIPVSGEVFAKLPPLVAFHSLKILCCSFLRTIRLLGCTESGDRVPFRGLGWPAQP